MAGETLLVGKCYTSQLISQTVRQQDISQILDVWLSHKYAQTPPKQVRTKTSGTNLRQRRWHPFDAYRMMMFVLSLNAFTTILRHHRIYHFKLFQWEPMDSNYHHRHFNLKASGDFFRTWA